MLSICIPVYNVDVTGLSHDIIKQCHHHKLEFEILIYDDGSSSGFKQKNQAISNYKEIKYIELHKNLGCAAIRNKMAYDASYNNLLFLDSDSEIPHDYIELYSPYFKYDFQIVNGGRIHPPTLPNREKSLRWKVGKIKEDFNVEHRSKVPNKSFMSNNFLIKQEIFNSIKFNEDILRSGHEDTMFGIELEKKGIEILHINNPVIHLGLEDNDVFIKKTKQRLETLYYLEALNKNNKLFYDRVTIIKYFKKVKRFRLLGLLNIVFKMFGKYMENMLYLPNPSMFLYDFYKITYYSFLVKYNKS